MKIILKRHATDKDMVEIWSADKRMLWTIVHVDAFLQKNDNRINKAITSEPYESGQISDIEVELILLSGA